ncbi:MAG: flagellar protein FlgN [Pseudomonadota bacterium]|nr:flagellar protein FlgN [Pseudomonadota bacterium]
MTPTAENSVGWLRASLERETELLQNFLQQLTDERVLLEQSDREALPELLAQKSTSIENLAALHRDRRETFVRLHPEWSTDQAEQGIAQQCASGELANSWQGRGELLRACDRANQINGRLVQAGRDRLQRLLQLLLGPEHANTYSAEGVRAQRSGHRTLGTA